MQENTVFSVLNALNCNEHVEKKGNLSYLSWAWAWQMVKSHFPDASYTIYESPDGWNYFTDGRTCWVKTGVTIQGLEHIEYLPVMDNSNKSIPLPDVKSFDANKAIQRSLTKACARHGLGLYIYAGEDLPDSADEEKRPAPSEPSQAVKARRQASGRAAAPKYTPVSEEAYWKIVEAYALGRPTKTGGEYRSTWIHTTHAGEEQIAKFDHDVENFKMANNL
jgi:hypothetical protein